MKDKTKGYYDVIPEDYSLYKKGLAIQRERYKEANLDNDFDSMVKCLENLKSELKNKAINKGNKEYILRIEKIILWYKCLPQKYTVRKEEGYVIHYPDNLHIKISQNLNIAYELLIRIMTILDLL